MRVYIDLGPGIGYQDYTQYVVDGTLTIEDSINVPTLAQFDLMASKNAFVVPKRSSYVKIVSEVYAKAGGYLTTGQSPLTDGKVLATGCITNELEREYQGLNAQLPSYGFQQLTYKVSVTSDEWLLNTKIVPFIPAFINQTQGQLLVNLANALAPGWLLDTTSFVASGDLVPYYEYSADQTWSDIAKTFADAARYRYKVIDRVLYFQPFGDQSSGLSYDESQKQIEKAFFPSDLKTVVVTTPAVNDALVLGDEEPQTKWDNYFVGDGFTSKFRLRHQMFRGSSTLLLQDDWTETDFSTDLWTVQDPQGQFALVGALNINQKGSPGSLNETYVLGKNGLELGGMLNLQHGEFQIVDTCDGIVGGVYVDTTLVQSHCVAGFSLSPSGTIVVTASGAGGVIIQPMLFGNVVGPTVVSQPNHHYQLQTWIGGDNWSRYEAAYRTLTGQVQYGGNQLQSSADVTFVITDFDLGAFIAVTGGFVPGQIPIQNPDGSFTYIIPKPPSVTKYTASNVSLPSFGAYALINGKNLNLAVNYTTLAQPPQGSLQAQALTGVSGGLLPIKPEALGEVQQYLLGFGFQNQTASITESGDSSFLEFYNDSIPGVGSRIRFLSWENGQAIARVQDPIAIAQEATVSGDNGLRSAIISNLQPVPRTSDECELAAAAVIRDREYPQWQGTYTLTTIARRYEFGFNPQLHDYPRTGRFLYVNSPLRAITGQNMILQTVRISVVEPRNETLQIEASFGPDQYLEKLLARFLPRSDKVLQPKETTRAPSPVALQSAGSAYLPMFASGAVVAIVDSVSGSYITIDVGAPPVSAAEVRRVDAGWGTNDSNLLGRFTTQQFSVQRTSRDQTFYVRPIQGTKTSRFSYAPRIVHPLIPGQPFPKQLILGGAAPQLIFDFPQSNVTPPADFSTFAYSLVQGNTFVSDIYGLEIRSKDNQTVLVQRVIKAVSDLSVELTALSGAIVSGAFFATGGFFATVYPYFFNLKWGYSAPYALTFDPGIGGCCADCVNPMDYGAIGDGVADDTAAVQTALSVAGWNAGNFSLYSLPIGPPPTLAGVRRWGTVVCLNSGFRFRVTAQSLDLTSPAASGFGVQAVALRIDSGVTLRVDGSLELGTGPLSLGTYPGVLLENRYAYQGGDRRIVIDGNGVLDALGLNLTTKMSQSPGLGAETTRTMTICGGYLYVLTGGTTAYLYKYELGTNRLVAKSAPITSNSGLTPVAITMPCDKSGYLYVPLGGAGGVGTIAVFDSNSLGLVTIKAVSCAPFITVPNYCHCTSLPCMGNMGELFYVPTDPGFIVGVDRLNVCGWNDAPILHTLGDGFGYAGLFAYAGCGLSNPFVASVAADGNGNIAILNPKNASEVWWTMGNLLGGTTPCSSCPTSPYPVPTLNVQLTKNIVADLGMTVGSPCIGQADLGGGFVVAMEGQNKIAKVDANGNVLTVVDLSAYSPLFDRLAFKNVAWPKTFNAPQPPGSGNYYGTMLIRGSDSFILFDTVAMSVRAVYPGIASQSGGTIPVGVAGQTVWDGSRNIGYFSKGGGTGPVFQLILGGVQPTTGIFKAEGSEQIEVKSVKIRKYSTYGVYLSNCSDSRVVDVKTPASDAQSGFSVLLDGCKGTLVARNSINGRSSTALNGVADYVGIGTRVEENVFVLLPGKGVDLQMIGFESRSAPSGSPFLSGLQVTNNTFVSGTLLSSYALVASPVGLVPAAGVRIAGNVVMDSAQIGIGIGNLQDAIVESNVVEGNVGGLVRTGQLVNVSILNNLVNGNISYDIPDPTSGASPVYNDGTSTVLMWNPAIDRQLYQSWVTQTPMVEGSESGTGGFVYPPAPPTSMYAVLPASASETSPIRQNGSAASYYVDPFSIQWPDKLIAYAGVIDLSTGLLTPVTPTHGYTLYHVFVDDPYRNGDVSQIQFGVTTQLADLATSAGRYYLGSILLDSSGGAVGTQGGMLPAGAVLTVPTTQPYDVAGIYTGGIPASFKIMPQLPMVRAVNFPANFLGSQGSLETAPTAQLDFTIKKNGTSIGTMTFAASSTVATFTTSGLPISMMIGDRLSVTASSSADASAADLGFILKGTRSLYEVSSQLSVRITESLNNWNDRVANSFPVIKLVLGDDNSGNWKDNLGHTP